MTRHDQPDTPTSGWQLWDLCAAGQYPAEALDRFDRAYLVQGLHARGLTDVQIAEWTQLSTYTAARIRTRLGLLPNRDRLRDRGRQGSAAS